MAAYQRQWWYPTAFSCWGEEERAAIARVVASGRFTQGEEVEAFEAEFAAYHGMRHAVMVNSGSSANLVMVSALRHLGLLPDHAIVAVPAIAWSTTYAPFVQFGAELQLLDVDETWNASLRSEPGDAQVIVGCSILGAPAHLDWWIRRSEKQGAIFVEDNCESLGAMTSEGKLCGTFGMMSTFSLFHSHQISAVEGGVILTDDDELFKLCRSLRAHGWTRDVQAPANFDAEYDFRTFGYNVRGLEMHAAIAREQLRKLPRFIKERTANLVLFHQLTDGLPIQHQRINGNGTPSPFGLAFALYGDKTVADDNAKRLVLAATLRDEGIDCRLPTGGSFLRHHYGRFWGDQKTPNADRIHDTGLFLGNGPLDLSDRISKAVEIMRRVL